MRLTVHLLGHPRIENDGGDVYRFRSRKSWALLALLVLRERAPTRSELASLLFAEADDPLRALRWNLSEIRRGLGEGGSLEGDPVELQLPEDTVVDVDVLTRGLWTDAVGLPGLGADLLDGIVIQGAPAFESWLLSEQRHVAAASEAILHEAALGSLSRGELRLALGYATRAAVMSPLDENHQALLIRLYRLLGDDPAAEQQHAACIDLFDRELGVAPGPAVEAAMRETRDHRTVDADPAAVEALVEAGSAAIGAGAVESGVHSLRSAVRLADRTAVPDLRVSSRLVLAEALIHALGGLDEEGVASLYEAGDIALASGDRLAVAQTRAELGYVDFLRARYERAEVWLNEACTFADHSPAILAKATCYLGSVESDRANYPEAKSLLAESAELSRVAEDPRREAFALSMLGRVGLLCDDLDTAAVHLDTAIALAEGDHWLALLPWPQALRGEVQLGLDDPAGAGELVGQAFARACQLGDPCWEGMSGRGVAMHAEATGETERAFEVLADASDRCNRLADPYVWLDGYILDAQCTLGRRHDHPDTAAWVDRLQTIASRTGMRELTVRSLLHRAALGHDGDHQAAALIAADLDNPALDRLVNG